jgi:hypothetical protein
VNLLDTVVFDSHLYVIEDYRENTHQLSVDGGVVLSGSFHGDGHVPPDIADEDVLVLARMSVRAIRVRGLRRKF